MELELLDEEDMMLTTIDNPYSPKTHYDEWRQWDIDMGYNTESYIARMLSLTGYNDIDDEFVLDRLTSEVISNILEHDDEELYRLV